MKLYYVVLLYIVNKLQCCQHYLIELQNIKLQHTNVCQLEILFKIASLIQCTNLQNCSVLVTTFSCGFSPNYYHDYQWKLLFQSLKFSQRTFFSNFGSLSHIFHPDLPYCYYFIAILWLVYRRQNI